MSNTLNRATPFKTNAELLTEEIIVIKSAAKGIEGILLSALSNASGTPEYDTVKAQIEAFRAALAACPIE